MYALQSPPLSSLRVQDNFDVGLRGLPVQMVYPFGDRPKGEWLAAPLLAPFRKGVDSFPHRGVGWDGVRNSLCSPLRRTVSDTSQRVSHEWWTFWHKQQIVCRWLKSEHRKLFTPPKARRFLLPISRRKSPEHILDCSVYLLLSNKSAQNLVAQSNNNRFIISHGYCGPGSQGWAQSGSSGSGSHKVVVRWRLVLEQHGTGLAGGWPSTSLSLPVVSGPLHVTASCVIAGLPNSTVVITQSHHQYPRWAGPPEADGSPMTFDPCIFDIDTISLSIFYLHKSQPFHASADPQTLWATMAQGYCQPRNGLGQRPSFSEF